MQDGIDPGQLAKIATENLPLIAWRQVPEATPGTQELTLLANGDRTLRGTPGTLIPLAEGMREEDGLLIWEAELPRWAMWPHWHRGSPSYTMSPGCQGEGLAMMVLALGLKGIQDPLLPFVDREMLSAIRSGLGEERSWPGETPQELVGPAIIQLKGGARPDGSPERMSLLTPCGEALRRSLHEIAGGSPDPAYVLQGASPSSESWTWGRPRPKWKISFDQGAGITALPWRKHAADDSALRDYGWRKAYEGEWDKQARQPGVQLQARIEEEESTSGKLRKVLAVEAEGRYGLLSARLTYRRQ